MSENNFPTVRTGSLWLLIFAGFLSLGITILAFEGKLTDPIVDAYKACLGALGGTHLILVGGKSFIMSKWSGEAPAYKKVTTEESAPVTPKVSDMNVSADNVTVSPNQNN